MSTNSTNSQTNSQTINRTVSAYPGTSLTANRPAGARVAAASTLELTEARIAAKLVQHLDGMAQALPHELSERLKVARGQALARAQAQRLARAKAAQISTAAGGAAVLSGPPNRDPFSWSGLAASLLPLLLLVAGLVAIEHLSQREHVLTAADIDAQLLSDDLPPAAYADPGFAEFLRSGRSR
jgi:hypothetical protein